MDVLPYFLRSNRVTSILFTFVVIQCLFRWKCLDGHLCIMPPLSVTSFSSVFLFLFLFPLSISLSPFLSLHFSLSFHSFFFLFFTDILTVTGDAQIADVLLGKGADLNFQNVNGDTPLHLSAANGHFEMLSYLLSHGADPSLKNKYFESEFRSGRREKLSVWDKIWTNFFLVRASHLWMSVTIRVVVCFF